MYYKQRFLAFTYSLGPSDEHTAVAKSLAPPSVFGQTHIMQDKKAFYFIATQTFLHM